MLNSLSDALNAAPGVLAVTALAAFGLQRTRIANLKDSLEEARGEIGDKDRRLHDLENEHAKHKAESGAEIVKLKAKSVSQEGDIAALGRQLRGESYWTELSDKLDRHHTAAETHWKADEQLLTQLHQDFTQLHQDFEISRDEP